ncbi:Ltp family lipoprotein [Oenococcus sp.]|uniref:Ltp family lipoprotein n=1 Tax=Oenococcus sp. TaxID=1979414 RepID=UPI0039EC52AF
MESEKKPLYRKWWPWFSIIILVFIIFGSLGGWSNDAAGLLLKKERVEIPSHYVEDSPISSPKSSDNKASKKSSSSAVKTSSSVPASSVSAKSTSSTVPADYRSALIKARQYATVMSMSKQGIYEQLTAKFVEGFSAQAAQYAINNLTGIDWNKNALTKAREYQNTMAMSPSAIHDQLTSAAGERFTQQEADYAIAHLNDK